MTRPFPHSVAEPVPAPVVPRKPQRVKITLQTQGGLRIAVIGVDFQVARNMSLLVFKGNHYASTGMLYGLKDEDHDDPDVDWRAHMSFERVGPIVLVSDDAEIVPKAKRSGSARTSEE